MLRVPHSRLYRYAIAVIAVELVLIFLLLLDNLIPMKGSPFVLCFAAVMVSAWYGGLGPALLATALTSLVCAYLYLPVVYSLAIAQAESCQGGFPPSKLFKRDDFVQLGLCMLEGVAVISLTGAQQFAKRRAQDKANAQLEQKVKQLQALTCQLQQQNEHLEEASRLKSEFLVNMSHELRTPLTSIMGFSSVLLQQIFGTLTVKQQEYLSCIHSSGEHLLSLINDLLDLNKIEAGKMELNLEAVDLAELCRDALQMIEVRALAKHQHLSLELPVAIKSIVVDRQRVLQILLNYLSNAVKFTPEGGTLALSTRLSSGMELKAQSPDMRIVDQSFLSSTSASGFLVLSVSDTGIGIPTEKQHLLFQTFQQVKGDLNLQDAGTGLGLALNRRLAELHGGTVSFTSTPGMGSTFSVWLPLRSQLCYP